MTSAAGCRFPFRYVSITPHSRLPTLQPNDNLCKPRNDKSNPRVICTFLTPGVEGIRRSCHANVSLLANGVPNSSHELAGAVVLVEAMEFTPRIPCLEVNSACILSQPTYAVIPGTSLHISWSIWLNHHRWNPIRRRGRPVEC